MAYFPFFTDIAHAPCLIVGGGTVAERKAEKLLPYGPDITVMAPTFSGGLRNMKGLAFREKEYEEGDEEGYSFVIAATDDREVNRLISTRCQERRIPVNVVDDRELCSFIFPTLVKRGALSIGISTSGSSPTAAIALKEKISSMLPADFGAMLDFLNGEREELRKTVPTESGRHEILKALFGEAMAKGRPLTAEEAEELRSRP